MARRSSSIPLAVLCVVLNCALDWCSLADLGTLIRTLVEFHRRQGKHSKSYPGSCGKKVPVESVSIQLILQLNDLPLEESINIKKGSGGEKRKSKSNQKRVEGEYYWGRLSVIYATSFLCTDKNELAIYLKST